MSPQSERGSVSWIFWLVSLRSLMQELSSGRSDGTEIQDGFTGMLDASAGMARTTLVG